MATELFAKLAIYT